METAYCLHCGEVTCLRDQTIVGLSKTLQFYAETVPDTKLAPSILKLFERTIAESTARVKGDHAEIPARATVG